MYLFYYLLVNACPPFFVLQSKSLLTTAWRCSSRSKGKLCYAAVTYREGEYHRGRSVHTHEPIDGALAKVKLSKVIKKNAARNILEGAGALCERVFEEKPALLAKYPDDQAVAKQRLQRAANRYRQSRRPKEPRTLDFEILKEAIPDDFLICDLNRPDEGRRSVVFGKSANLPKLAAAKEWYVDGTFRIVGKPFLQLWTIHIFIGEDEFIKQFPMIYVLMSNRTTEHYIDVLQEVKRVLPSAPQVKRFIADFEVAQWNAMREVFPGIRAQGCGYHWTQAVYRHIQGFGLDTAYKKRGNRHRFMRELMVLPFAQANDIPEQFERLATKGAELGPDVIRLLAYIRKTWLKCKTWPVSDWCVFDRDVRTNNDCEGWHRKINSSSRERMGFYELTKRIHSDALTVARDIKSVLNKKLKRSQKSKYMEKDRKIRKLWQKNQRGQTNAKTMLTAISHLHGPIPQTKKKTPEPIQEVAQERSEDI